MTNSSLFGPKISPLHSLCVKYETLESAAVWWIISEHCKALYKNLKEPFSHLIIKIIHIGKQFISMTMRIAKLKELFFYLALYKSIQVFIVYYKSYYNLIIELVCKK